MVIGSLTGEDTQKLLSPASPVPTLRHHMICCPIVPTLVLYTIRFIAAIWYVLALCSIGGRCLTADVGICAEVGANPIRPELLLQWERLVILYNALDGFVQRC